MYEYRRPWDSEYAGSLLTSCQPLTNCERLALYFWKRGEVPFYRVINGGVKHVKRNRKE